MKRVLIIGNSGSGKTTFAKKLSEKTGIALIYLDKIWWRGEWEHVSREEFDEALGLELSKEEWIIDGNYDRTLPRRLEYADTVFFFDFPTSTCLWGITKRILKSYGKSREDMGGNCPESFGRAAGLYKSTLSYNRRNRKRYYEMIKRCGVVTVFRNHRDVRKYLEKP